MTSSIKTFPFIQEI